MGRLNQIDLRGTTSAGGAASIVTSGPHFGYLYAVEWVDGDLANGVDATLKVTSRHSAVDRTLLTLTDADSDAFYYPREQVHNNAGAGLDYNDESDEPVETLPLIDGELTCTIASGGDTKTGGMIVTIINGN